MHIMMMFFSLYLPSNCNFASLFAQVCRPVFIYSCEYFFLEMGSTVATFATTWKLSSVILTTIYIYVVLTTGY